MHSPIPNLNRHGDGCRCLLRLRENSGKPGLSDHAFIEANISRFPSWHERPGEADLLRLCELARNLQLADKVELFLDYDQVLKEHQAGRAILVLTERSPEQEPKVGSFRRHVLLLVGQTEQDFTLWCPFASGLSDVLPKGPRACWDRWLASALVLYPA